MLGKRKRDSIVIPRESAEEGQSEIVPTSSETQEIFRRYFETRFKPLEGDLTRKSLADDSHLDCSDDDSGSEWDGISDPDTQQVAEVIEHVGSLSEAQVVSDKQARKEFMTAKPPSTSVLSASKLKPALNGNADDLAMEAENLKNDLALQRLLKESHLLDSAFDLSPSGSKRHRALDLRMQAVGAKSSLFTRGKMPMSHRKGIKTKELKKEETRRREARENGIILEKPTLPSKSKTSGKRERGIAGPSVGKFTGGTLRLSRRDLLNLRSPRKGFKARRKSRK